MVYARMLCRFMYRSLFLDCLNTIYTVYLSIYFDIKSPGCITCQNTGVFALLYESLCQKAKDQIYSKFTVYVHTNLKSNEVWIGLMHYCTQVDDLP